MSKLLFITLLFVSSNVVFVASQQSCSESDDCDEGSCCYDRSCTTDRFMCALVEERDRLKSELQPQQCTYDFQCSGCSCINGRCKDCSDTSVCYGDWECTHGCCVDSTCHSKISWQCMNKNSCTKNSDCDSGCCKNNECQDTKSECSKSCYRNWDCDSDCCKDYKCQDTYGACSYPTTAAFITTPAPLKHCYSHSDCSSYTYYYTSQCCVNERCQACSTTSYYPRLIQTTSYPDYPDNNDDYDYNNGRSSSSSGGLGVGGSIGIGVAVIFLVILKLALWASCCARHRQRGVIIVRRRVTCVAVPIVENDELQREHERAAEGVPDRPPPAYSPRPFESNEPSLPVGPPPEYSAINENTNSVQTDQTQTGGDNGNTEEINGIPQGSIMVPPPAYSPNPVTNPNENNSSAQTDQTRGSGDTGGNAEEMNGVPQGNTIIPPSVTSPDLPVNPSENTTGQNSVQTHQRGEVTDNTEELNGDPQGNTIGPFII